MGFICLRVMLPVGLTCLGFRISGFGIASFSSYSQVDFTCLGTRAPGSFACLGIRTSSLGAVSFSLYSQPISFSGGFHLPSWNQASGFGHFIVFSGGFYSSFWN
ncbi:2982_t:CDS:2 [Racocetra persica]|uniref:2982_t:CDS:1 n=1 Tax=Racocetra persica TaxID=160502 RepID=A0ACA9KKL2_9GLOM|nr:2982_t:CDS:2 [Racocetra persica]